MEAAHNMMSYRVQLTAYIWNEDRTAYIRGEKEITLPFPPTLGTKLQFDEMTDALEIKEVAYRMEDGTFSCKVEPDCVCKFELAEGIEELADLLDSVRDLRNAEWAGLDRVWRGS